MNHSFDIEVAAKYGVIEAVLYENIRHWLRENHAKNINIHDGKPWTFNSVKAYARIFPYLTLKQIRRALDSLVYEGALIKGEYNKRSYDKTSWYSVPDLSVIAICPKGRMDKPKRANREARMGKPIPDINQNINQNIKQCDSLTLVPDIFEHTTRDGKKQRITKNPKHEAAYNAFDRFCEFWKSSTGQDYSREQPKYYFGARKKYGEDILHKAIKAYAADEFRRQNSAWNLAKFFTQEVYKYIKSERPKTDSFKAASRFAFLDGKSESEIIDFLTKAMQQGAIWTPEIENYREQVEANLKASKAS